MMMGPLETFSSLPLLSAKTIFGVCSEAMSLRLETAQVWQLLEFLHYGHGDQPGTCASACDNVCNHQPCFDDFKVSDGGDRCECIRNLSQSRCASSNSRCVEDECECLEGFAGNPTVSCENIDECSDSELNNCGPNAECIDQTPGFTSCECEKGYSGDPFSTIGCEDDNECLDSDICGSQGTCDNTDGGYVCECNNGYRWDAPDGICENINDFQDPAATCGDFASCSDLPGSFKCSCNSGYAVDEGEPSPKNSCQDEDECDADPPVCGENTVCSNTDGSFTSQCATGFEGNPPSDPCQPGACTSANISCGTDSACDTSSGTQACICPEGYEGDGNILCNEIDECAENTDDCTADQNCFNRPPGSFTCLIKEFRQCPKLGEDSVCSDGLQCAKTSRSDDTPVCCEQTGLCLDEVTECCSGAYSRGEACPSKSSDDCAPGFSCDTPPIPMLSEDDV